MTNSSSLIINQPNNLTGEIFVPGDKSITHRAIMLGSLSSGRLDIKNSLLSEDCKRTVDAFIKLGVNITINDTTISIYGKGLNSLKPPSSIIDAGNSGTLARLISGVLAVQNFDSSISGDCSLVKRPMKRIIDPLTVAGANISSSDNLMPLSFKQSTNLKIINYTCLIPSAQIKSCLILASLFLDGTSIIKETIKTRDHTERMLQFLDYPISINDNVISIDGNGTISAKDIKIPSDISSASFLIVGALIKPNSNIILKSIGINSLRTGIIDVLIKMGADIKMVNHTNIGNEPVADIIVRSSILKPVNLSGDIISRLIDELPILFIACACCEGVSVIKDIEELRHKESDRIKSMEEGLIALGIKVESTTNSIQISGGSFKGGIVNSNSDHRVAMSFLIAGLVSLKPITVINTDNINTSFPNFVDILRDQNNEIYDL
tara:strand:+ start:1288 stop:2592 length:1305 start_codon:yes stop_codon:yes gene_type:complete